MNADRMAKIEEVKQSLGLDQATADKVIKAVQSKRVAGTMEMFRKSGELTLDKVLEAASDGVDVSDFMGEDSRMGLYRTEVERLLSNGECAYENDKVRVELVEKLKLAEKKANDVVNAAATERRRLTLVQAVSGLRQKNASEVVRSLNNLVCCERAVPEGPVVWKEQEEIKDLFCAFVGAEKDEAKVGELQAVLGLGDAEAKDLKEMVDSGKFKLAATTASGSPDAFF